MDRWRNRFTKVWAIIGILILLAVAGWLLARVSAALVPFAIGLVITLLLRKPVEYLARLVPRPVAVMFAYLVAMSIVVVAFAFIIPPVYTQVAEFVGNIPDYATTAYDWWNRFVTSTGGAGTPDWLHQAILSLRDQVVAGAGTWSSALAAYAVSTGSGLASGIIGFALALIIGFYTLVDLPHLEREVYVLAGEGRREEITHALRTTSRVLGGWFRGTLIASTVVATLISLGLWIAGVPYSLAIGIAGGLFNVVPYVGPVLTAVIAGAAGLFVSPLTALWGVLVVLVVQQIDSLLVGPRVMSEQVDLHPLVIIFSLLVGAALFGTVGMVLSVPFAAVVKGLVVYWAEKRGQGDMFSTEGVLLKTAGATEEPAEHETPAEAASEDAPTPTTVGREEAEKAEEHEGGDGAS
jgi:predicted PurR-regulated permease PerM